jgi:hypothetical protein
LVIIQRVDPLAVRLDLDAVRLEILLLIRVLADHHRHLHAAHVINTALVALLLRRVRGLPDLA